jgi:16S rRNA (guanine527-N7)-methyltransferase
VTEDRGAPRATEADAGSGAAGKLWRRATAPPPAREPLPTRLEDLPPLPAPYYEALARGLPAVSGVELDAADLKALEGQVRLLLAWNAAINLSGIRDPAAIALEHVLDSLTAVPILRRAGVTEFLDIGSGAGYPGLPLAVALPATRALLVESIGKKARFLAVVAEALGLADRVRVAATRAETLAADPHHRGRWPAVVARAVSDLPELTELSMPLLVVGGALVAWRKTTQDAEIDQAEPAFRQLGARVALLEAVTVPGLEDHVLLIIEKVAPTRAEFPRDPAARRSRPLGGAPAAARDPEREPGPSDRET